ncbi:MAG: hypothetical protein DME82_10985 [Verrucomicrobia bacterium]|nr:MAG: hypothetical protein DME82_10985 [Verrucomicrobiota bacterium]
MIVLRSGNSIPQLWVALGVSVCAAVAFYFSTNATLHDLDYTTDIASALLRGDLGLREKPPEWLNEMIPHGDRYYSAFPLGAVLSMIPIALLQKARLIHNFPGHVLASLIAGCCVYFFFQLAKAFGANYSSLEPSSLGRRILLALFPVFGTWTWCNLGFGGAWQIALGLALLGQTAALYFTLVRPSPLVAGTFFALAYGNRTELLITAPLYLYFFWQRSDRTAALWSRSMLKQELGKNGPLAIRFLSVPVCLAILTAAYNFARFHSIFDFGYTHIPEVHEEPWYEHGLFSIQAVPWNIYTMLFQGFASLSYFPYIEPNGFGCSIFLASPFLCLLFREGGKYKIAAWVAIAVLTLVLWCHGNPGSWQFSYRYAMILLPWMFLLLTGNGPPRLTMIEISLFTVSVAMNALAMWLFLWTDQIQGE